MAFLKLPVTTPAQDKANELAIAFPVVTPPVTTDYALEPLDDTIVDTDEGTTTKKEITSMPWLK